MTRLTSNFNGSSFNGKSLVVYGDGGIILRSTNCGINWEQISLNDSLNIHKIVIKDSLYIGISNKNHILFSVDDGITWKIHEKNKDIKFQDIFLFDDIFIIILHKRIWLLNKNFEIIREISYPSEIVAKNWLMLDSKIIYSADAGKFGVIDLITDITTFIYLKSLINRNSYPLPLNLLSDNVDKIYFTLDNEYYYYNFSEKKAGYIFKTNKTNSSKFFFKNGEIFQIYNNTFDWHLDSLYFVKYNVHEKILTNVKQSGNDRYIFNLKFSYLNFINNDTVIAVGHNKLIYMSYNAGINWVLKSSLNEYSSLFLIDSLNVRIIAPYARFFSTTDGGVTWLPQINYSINFTINSNITNPSNYPTIRYFFDKDNGFFFGDTFLQQVDSNFFFSKDGGKSVEIKKVSHLQSLSYQFKPTATIYNNNLLLLTHRDIGKPIFSVIDRLSNEFEIEKSYSFADKIFLSINNYKDTLYAICSDTNIRKNIISIYFSTDTARTWTNLTSFELDIDITKFYLISTNFNNGNVFLVFSYAKNDPRIFNYIVYLINLNEKIKKEILNFDDFLFFIFNLKNRYHIFLQKENITEILYTDNINRDIIEWKKNIFYRYSVPRFNLTEPNLLPLLKSFISDSIFAFVSFDSLHSCEVLFLAKVKRIGTDTIDIGVDLKNQIYLSTPYPNPSHDHFKMKLYWDSGIEIDNINFFAHNILGMLVSDRNEFNFKKINSNSGELIWQPKNLPLGVYMVNVQINNINGSILVVKY